MIIIGVDSIGWRYDPVFLNEKYTIERHLLLFEKIASKLSGYTKTCVISFIDLYSKVRKNFPEVRPVSKQDRLTLGRAFIEIGRKYGMTIKPCGEGDELAAYGADCSGCMIRTLHFLSESRNQTTTFMRSGRPAGGMNRCLFLILFNGVRYSLDGYRFYGSL